MDSLTEFTFENAVSKDVSVVLFSGQKCPACVLFKPVFEKVSSETPGVKFFVVDAHDNLQLADKHGIASIPQMIMFKDGKEKSRLVGFHGPADFVHWLALDEKGQREAGS